MNARRVLAENKPWAGLGNRLRFTLSARAVADVEGRAFAYSWPVDEQFGAAMTDLWVYDVPAVPRVGGAPFDESTNVLDHRDEPLWHIQSASVVKGDGTERSWEDDLHRLRLQPHLQAEADKHRLDLELDYVGVQIRLNDKTHAKTLEASPLSWYEQRMREMLAADPTARFFISCDVPAVQADLLRRFPSARAVNKRGGYNTREALEDSVIDLYVLAGSKHLLGPYWSSFVQTAWIIGGKSQPLETSQQTRQPQPRLVAPLVMPCDHPHMTPEHGIAGGRGDVWYCERCGGTWTSSELEQGAHLRRG